MVQPARRLQIKKVKIQRHGRVVATKGHPLTLKTKGGATYLVIKVTKQAPGKLTLVVKNAPAGSGAPHAVTTQVSQSKAKKWVSRRSRPRPAGPGAAGRTRRPAARRSAR